MCVCVGDVDSAVSTYILWACVCAWEITMNYRKLNWTLMVFLKIPHTKQKHTPHSSDNFIFFCHFHFEINAFALHACVANCYWTNHRITCGLLKGSLAGLITWQLYIQYESGINNIHTQSSADIEWMSLRSYPDRQIDIVHARIFSQSANNAHHITFLIHHVM